MKLTEIEKDLITVAVALSKIESNVIEQLNKLDCTKLNNKEISGIEVYTKSDLRNDGDFVWAEGLKDLPDSDVDYIRVDDYGCLKFVMFNFGTKEIEDYELLSSYEE